MAKYDPLNEPLDFETLAVHAGVEPEATSGAVMTPIFQTSTYAQPEVGVHLGYEYSRTDNPTRTALQTSLASLEGARHALSFASGMAATDTVLRLLQPGEHVISGDDVYGGTFRLFDKVLRPAGIDFSFVDTTDPDRISAALTPKTKLVWLETPTNPLLKLTDIAAVAARLDGHGAWLAVDNTFASPALQQPLGLGADLVVHSTSKYLGGHSDVIGGAVMVNDEEIYERLKFLQNGIGAVPSPMDCFLTLRGIKTLALRMAAHSANGLALARMLEDHPGVSRVIYPTLESHPQHRLARRQMNGQGGGIVSFVVHGGEAAARKVAETTQLFLLAESLGGVESLIEVPHVMTHASVADSPLAVDPGLVRISAGIESARDLVDDLRRAVDAGAPTGSGSPTRVAEPALS